MDEKKDSALLTALGLIKVAGMKLKAAEKDALFGEPALFFVDANDLVSLAGRIKEIAEQMSEQMSMFDDK